MKKLFKLLLLVAFVCAVAYTISYAGARATVGRFLGLQPPEMGTRAIRFAYDGVAALPGKPRVWEFSYSRVSINGNRPAKIYVSPGGKIVATVPKDLDRMLEAFAKSKEVQ